MVNNAFKQFVFDPDQPKLAWQLTREDYKGQIDGAVRSTHLRMSSSITSNGKTKSG